MLSDSLEQLNSTQTHATLQSKVKQHITFQIKILSTKYGVSLYES